MSRSRTRPRKRPVISGSLRRKKVLKLTYRIEPQMIKEMKSGTKESI
jgi:hypothetical protein